MEYYETITLSDGRVCVLRNGDAGDGAAVREIFIRTHAQTDNMLTYPDECGFTPEQEDEFLKKRTDSPDEIEIVAELDGAIVGTAGINRVGGAYKLRRRAEFGVGIDKDCWGLGIGRALTRACVECARRAGYAQLELDVVADNERAVGLYKSEGFVEYGRNPRGFYSRFTGWQELVLMRLELM